MLALIVLPGILFQGSVALAHGGEDHGEAAAAQSVTPAAQGSMLTSHGSTTLFELLLKYPVTYAGEDTRVRFFLADFATNRPLEGAQFKLAFKPAGVEVAGAPKMISPGVYDLIARFPGDTVYSLVATVSVAGRTDFVEVRNIYAGEAAERFLAEHGGAALPAQSDEAGFPWLIALGATALALIVATLTGVLLRRRSTTKRESSTTGIPRDPELMATGATSSTPEPPHSHGR